MVLDLRRLRLLRELSSRGTIAAVAEVLSYSPSTVSQQLAELQREAGVRLFERDGRRIRLTEAAHVLARHADALLDRMEHAEAETAAAAGAVAGTVRVGAFQTAAINIVAPAMTILQARYPGLRVEVEDVESERAIEAVALRELDLAVCDEHESLPRPRPPSLAFEELYAEEISMVVSARRGPVRSLGELAAEPWAAGRAGYSHERMVTHLCGTLGGFVPDIRHRATDLLVLLALVAAGQAVTLLPSLARPEREPGVHVQAIAETPVRRHIITAVREASRARPAVRAVCEALREAAETLPRRIQLR